MSFFKERPGAKSIAAFLFMPQFRLMLPQFAMTKGIFSNMLAIMMVQAGLLPLNHPAAKQDGKTYRIRDLIGEAWFTIRTSDHVTPYQYAMFGALMLMMAFLVLMVVTALASLLFSATAHAQPGPLFSDMTPDAPGAATRDLAERMLDGVLLMGSEGTGGPMQNALGPLLAMYSWGVLVVGAFMVFWAVISIVAETARTGQLGGNRHNMLWAPIRLVFAIGLLVPLGFGFNSGQYIVIKVAEWGTNLGTRGWTAYVDAIVADENLIANAQSRIPYREMNALMQILVCKEAYNQQLEGYDLAGAADYQIVRTTATETGTTAELVMWGNNIDPDLCGTMKFQNPADPDIAPDISAAAMTTLRTAQRASFIAMEAALAPIAQQIVAKQLAFKAAWDGPFPAITTLNPPLAGYVTNMNAAIVTARTQLETSIKAGALVTEVKNAGWPGAGIWYHKIAQLNESMQDGALALPEITGPNTANMVESWGEWASSFVYSMPPYEDWHAATSKILNKYNDWWTGNARTLAAGGAGSLGGESSYATAAASIQDNTTASSTLWYYVNKIFGSERPFFLFDIDPDEDIYPLGRLAQIGNSLVNWALLAYGSMAVLSMAAGLMQGSGVALFAGPVGALLGMLGSAIFTAGAVLLWYVPLIPFIRVFFALMAWIYLVFEAVAMMPIFALMHLQTDGEGLPGSAARTGYLMLLGLLFRPILIVIGFVAALLIFNTAVPILHETLKAMVGAVTGDANLGLLSMIAYSIIYVGMVYILANSTFKTIDIIPNAVMKWIGGPQEGSSDESGELIGMTAAGAGFAMNALGNVGTTAREGAAAYAEAKQKKGKGAGDGG